LGDDHHKCIVGAMGSTTSNSIGQPTRRRQGHCRHGRRTGTRQAILAAGAIAPSCAGDDTATPVSSVVTTAPANPTDRSAPSVPATTVATPVAPPTSSRPSVVEPASDSTVARGWLVERRRGARNQHRLADAADDHQTSPAQPRGHLRNDTPTRPHSPPDSIIRGDTTMTAPTARIRLRATVAVNGASLVLSRGTTATISYQSTDDISGTLVPASADHADSVRHERGRHIRTASAPSSLGSAVAGGRISYR
jgi:hypothetical protein